MSDPAAPSPLRLAVGVMTGTSVDAIDAALVEIAGEGLDMRGRLVSAQSWSLGSLAGELRSVGAQHPTTAGELARLRTKFGRLCASCVTELVGSTADVALIAVHGQTVFHEPPVSWQMIDPVPIAHSMRAPVIFDLRGSDLAAGGQGAPMTPLADWVLLRDDAESRAIVNLGGFCNVTTLPAGGDLDCVTGCDVCACNQVLDACARSGLGQPFDDQGAAATSGHAHALALAQLCGILEAQRDAGRSLGTGDEADRWVMQWTRELDGPDLCRTCCEGIAASVAAAVGAAGGRVLLAGGGVKNTCLASRIESLLGGDDSPASGQLVGSTDAHGVPAAYREAMAMAVLGALAQDRVPVTLSQVTGRSHDVMVGGSWVLP